ncbi:hypothetical protein BJ742DRAFT_826851 [Cladochytrium replicatum]|nr:hypothetical protein BJ742DRAFT_826851 [Cladochytrium replicatum]
MAANWSTVESDPGVFTELIESFGVKGVQVEELFDLSQLEDLKPVYGLIFLFKYVPSPDSGPIDLDAHVWFAKQVIVNSCSTQAILSILLNRNEIASGEMLESFKTFTSDFTPELKGLAISNSDDIRLHHNSFARADPFLSEGFSNQDDSEDLFHFISYLPVNGVLWEMDGLREGPINHGTCTEENWFEIVRPIIEKRIAAYSSNEIRFNLLALIRSRADVLSEQLASDSITEFEREHISMLLSAAREKRELWKKENMRRKHNFVGFTYSLLREMAKAGLLTF